jgi:hypothetical protein
MRTACLSLLLAALFLLGEPEHGHATTCDVSGTGSPVLPIGPEEQQHDAMLERATACVNEQRPARAVALLTQLIKLDPADPTAYLNRGSQKLTFGSPAALRAILPNNAVT